MDSLMTRWFVWIYSAIAVAFVVELAIHRLH